MPTTMTQIKVLRATETEKMEFPWGGLTWYASGSQANSDDMTIGRCLLKPGQGNPRHYHPNCSEVLVVMQGKIRHTISDGQETEMNVGDTVTIPANVWHQARNIGDNDALLFIAFSSPDRKTIGE